MLADSGESVIIFGEISFSLKLLKIFKLKHNLINLSPVSGKRLLRRGLYDIPPIENSLSLSTDDGGADKYLLAK